MAHLVFDVIAKDPKKQHVARQMHPATVQEHGCQQPGVTFAIGQPRGQ